MGTQRYLKSGLVVALVVSLMLAGVTFAAPLLQHSRVAVTCLNTGLAQSAQSRRFAGPSQHPRCSGPRHKRGLAGRIPVVRVPEESMPVPPVIHGQAGTPPTAGVAGGTSVAQPPREGSPPGEEIPGEGGPPGEEPPGEGETPGEEVPPDTTPPQTSISAGPASMTGSTSATFFFASSETGSSFECSLDEEAWEPCAAPRKSYSGLSIGKHEFSVRATDPGGNVDPTPATRSWTIEDTSEPPADEMPPQTSIVRGPTGSTTTTTATFSLSSSESGSSFDCNLDDEGWEPCAAMPTYTELEAGEHEFAARAVDANGNVDPTPATREWTIEEPLPPPTESAGCTSVVASVSTVRSAVSAAAAGSTICLANGSYGEVTLNASKAAPGVTLRAQNPGGATIEGASLSGSHLTLARFVISNGVVIQPGASSITVEHNRITGGGEGIDACPTERTYCSEMRIIGNQLVGPFGEDAIHANRYHGLYVEGNEITQVRENGNHSDCLQTVWRGDHIYFKRNYLHDNRCQGFFIKDQTMSTPEIPGGPIEGVVVEDNLFLRNKEPCGAPATSCGQPIYFQPVAPFTGFVMKRNTIWGDGMDSIAAFRGEGSVGSDTLVENNVIYRLWTDWNMTPATLRNNTVCMRETSAGGSFSTPTGETKACSLGFANTAADDYRLSGERGVDWAPSEVHYGP